MKVIHFNKKIVLTQYLCCLYRKSAAEQTTVSIYPYWSIHLNTVNCCLKCTLYYCRVKDIHTALHTDTQTSDHQLSQRWVKEGSADISAFYVRTGRKKKCKKKENIQTYIFIWISLWLLSTPRLMKFKKQKFIFKIRPNISKCNNYIWLFCYLRTNTTQHQTHTQNAAKIQVNM